MTETGSLTLDLDKYSESLKSTAFGFALNKHALESFDDKAVEVTYNGEVLTHMVNKSDSSGEYKFVLRFGGESDNL